jgi:hypothetical protein
MSAAIYLQAISQTPGVPHKVLIGDERRVQIEAIVDGLTYVPPDTRLNALASAFVESFTGKTKPITLTDRKIVIDPISEKIPLDFIE